ncbi:unnamed protein product [Soboliphyme baturini]|uniref:Luc7-like protein 3 n=1 Tax=Soboliphyme baturini TaxID=241478 RepID=A0A183IEW8_9BILA|nr:unnamed protein product [Soboliphyme baturini]
MSATKELASMLDELMGRHRNALPSERPKETTWDDPEVCKYFLVSFCPHEMFTNTKADLGHCEKIHDERLKEQYLNSSRFQKAGLEEDFLAFLQKLHSDMQRKIKKNKQRLELTQPGGQISDMNKERLEEKIKLLSDKIIGLQAQAEHLGAQGKVDEAQGVIKMADELTDERDHCKRAMDTPLAELKLMEVCEICGCFLIVGDSQHRIDEHLTGKQHVGYAKIKDTIDQMIAEREKRRRDKEAEARKEEEEMQKRREPEKKRHHSRSRDRSHKRSSQNRNLAGVPHLIIEAGREPKIKVVMVTPTAAVMLTAKATIIESDLATTTKFLAKKGKTAAIQRKKVKISTVQVQRGKIA